MGRGKKLMQVCLILLMASLAQKVYAGTGQENLNGEETGSVVEKDPEENREEGEPEDGGQEELPPLPGIQGYELSFAEPDGENGYYRSFPGVSLRHRDECLVTSYLLRNPQGEEEQGKLTMEEPEKMWEAVPMDGVWELELSVQMREDAGDRYQGSYPAKELEEWTKKLVFQVDNTPPVLEILSPLGTDTWYRGPVLVKARAEDFRSGIQSFLGGTAEKTWQSENGTELIFLVEKESVGNQAVTLRVTARDMAGNQTEKTLELFIDRTAPRITAEGPEDFQVLPGEGRFAFTVAEANILSELSARVQRKTPEGNTEELETPLWQESRDGSRYLELAADQDGIYQVTVTAEDAAGNRSTWKRQVTIDRTAPVLFLPEGTAGRWLKEFSWDYRQETAVEDFTACQVLVQLDGKLYAPGQTVRTEGVHLLEVRARDMAGNESEASLVFRIDRTAPVILVRNAEGEPLSDGDSATGTLQVEICTENTGDRLCMVRINGEEMALSRSQVRWGGELSETGVYEIQAEAVDLAGNRTVRNTGIRILPEEKKESHLRLPWQNTGRTKGTEKSPAYTGESPRKQILWTAGRTAVLVLGLLCAGGSVMAGFFYWKWKRREETS